MNRVDVMTVREMIDSAVTFEGDCSPIVDFKMIESVLFIIARHMKILQRHVIVAVRDKRLQRSTLSVDELKVHAVTVKKKKRGRGGKSPVNSKSTKKRQSRADVQPSGPSVDHGHGSKTSKSRSRSISKKGKSSDAEIKYSKKKSRSSSRARSISKKQKETIRSDPSDTSADDQHWKKKRSTSRRRSRSRSMSEKRKHYRSPGGRKSLLTSQEKSNKGKRTRNGASSRSQRSRSRDDEDDDSMEILREKLLIVSRSSTESDHRGSVVTQSQFDDMVTDIRKLQAKFGMKDMFADSDTPWSKLHKPTSLTDPRAALNMAARLDVAEKKAADMLKGMTAYAKQIPGINIETAFDPRFLPRPNVGPSEQTSTATSTTVKADSNDNDVEEQIGETALEEEDNLATRKQLEDGLREIRIDFLHNVPADAEQIKASAKRASMMLHQTEPKLLEAQRINSKYVSTNVMAEAFANKVTHMDEIFTSQMSDCQENLSQMQYELEVTLERIDDIIAHPKEDPNAVAAIKEDFTSLHYHLGKAYYDQKDLEASHTHGAADLKTIWMKAKLLQNNKTTRDEVLEALKGKASLNDLNGLLAKEQFYAVVGVLEEKIVNIKQSVCSGEIMWQKLIDELTIDLHDRANRDQVETLNHSMHTCILDLNGKLKKMLDIVGEYRVNNFKKKIDRDGNCLCCGSPVDITLPEEYLEVVKSMMKPEEKLPKVEESKKHPCIPGLPIPHSLDPRALVCERYCGASIDDTESLPSSFGLDILNVNPGKIPIHKSLTSVYLGEKKPCTPCTRSEVTLQK